MRVHYSDDVVEEAGHHPSILYGMKQSADRDASELCDSAHVLCWSLLHLQLPLPGVDEDSLSWTRGASDNNLSQQGRIPWDLHGVEVGTQWPLGACSVLVVNLIHDTLSEE